MLFKTLGKKMSKTKTVRATHEDAFIFEQTVRELAAELQQEVKVSELLKELVSDVPQAKKRLKKRIIETRGK